MSHNEIAKSLELLEKDWDIDSVIKDFHLGKRDDVSENSIKIGNVVFHIPFLTKIKKFILKFAMKIFIYWQGSILKHGYLGSLQNG